MGFRGRGLKVPRPVLMKALALENCMGEGDVRVLQQLWLECFHSVEVVIAVGLLNHNGWEDRRV